MTTARRTLTACAIGVLGTAVVCSCAYDWDLPETGIEPITSGDGALPEAATPAEAAAEAAPPDAEPEAEAAAPDAAPDADAGPTDAASSDGSDIISDAAPDAPPPEDAGPDCDVDGDGYAAEGSCGGSDCDDSDPRRNPGVTAPQSHDGGATGGDWNCNGVVERLYNYNVSCAGLALGECTNVEGFTTSPRCGQSGTYVTCRPGGALNLLCVVGTSEVRTQQCR